jgi:site-specific DNA recombinase
MICFLKNFPEYGINVVERQKVLRLIVKEIQLDDESLTIKHSIPLTTPSKTEKPIKGPEIISCLLRSGRHHPALWNAPLTPGLKNQLQQSHHLVIVDPFGNFL